MTVIERELGIPRSTLSGWFRSIILTEEQRMLLMRNSHDGWAKARIKSVEEKRAAKARRIKEAERDAQATLGKITLSPEILDLAFAMLYFGEGAKSRTTSLGSSDPNILKFVIKVLGLNYKLYPEKIICELHLRADQDIHTTKIYWSQELSIPVENFRSAHKDPRTKGRPTYPHYKGVCVLQCGNIAIQRKLISLYTLFCRKIAEL